ncbi:MAG TPA: WD40 repeat domain-containing protein, partial [Gemmataceae bacterium]
LAVRLRGAHCQCFLDDKLVFEHDDAKNPHGAVGLLAAGPFRFKNIRVVDPAGKMLFERLPKLPTVEGQWLPATEGASASELFCLKGHNARVTCVAFSRAGQILSGSYGLCNVQMDNGGWTPGGSGATIGLWDEETGKELDRSSDGQNTLWKGILKVAVSPDGTHLLSSSVNGPTREIRLWKIDDDKLPLLCTLTKRTGKEVIMCFNHLFSGTGIGFTPDGRKALVVNQTGSLWEWDVNDKVLVRQLPGTLKDVSCAAIAPNGKIALLARRNQPFAEIDLSTGKETDRWEKEFGGVQIMAFASDSTQVLTGGQDGAVRLWDVASGKQIRFVGRHKRPVLAVAFSPDGKRALSGSEDQTVRLWDLATGKKELACFNGHTGAVQAVAFSHDGRRAASGSADYTIRLWRLPP